MNWLNRLICRWRGHEWSLYETSSLAGRICTRCGLVIPTLIVPPDLARRRACARLQKGTL